MTTQDKNNTLFVSALKEAVRHYPDYFYLTGELNEIDSMWDMQPQFGMLEHLLLENESTQQFIAAIWSFFQPISFGKSGFAESVRAIEPWQRTILSQLLIHDPLSADSNPNQTTESDIDTTKPL